MLHLTSSKGCLCDFTSTIPQDFLVIARYLVFLKLRLTCLLVLKI